MLEVTLQRHKDTKLEGKDKLISVLKYHATHSHVFFTSTLHGGEWSPSERTLWVGPITGLDTVVERKFPAPAGSRTLELRSSSP